MVRRVDNDGATISETALADVDARYKDYIEAKLATVFAALDELRSHTTALLENATVAQQVGILAYLEIDAGCDLVDLFLAPLLVVQLFQPPYFFLVVPGVAGKYCRGFAGRHGLQVRPGADQRRSCGQGLHRRPLDHLCIERDIDRPAGGVVVEHGVGGGWRD